MSEHHTAAAGAADGAISLVDRAHREIHKRITDGAYGDRQRIVIDRVARELGISLVPVREALSRLQAEGLVVARRNQGFQVAPPLSAAELAQLFDARLVLEEGAVDLALGRGVALRLAPLRAANERIASGTYGTTFEGFREFVTLNEAFHSTLVALSANAYLEKAYRRLAYHQLITRPTSGIGVPDRDEIVGEHDAIIVALERADRAAARDAVRAHICGGRDRLCNRID